MASRIEQVIAHEREKLDAKDEQASARMRAIYQRQAEALMRELTLVTNKIEDARSHGVQVHPDWLRRQSSYTRLLYQVDNLYASFTSDGQHLLQQVQIDAGQLGAQAGRAQLNAVGISTSFEAKVNVPATERLAMSFDDESPLRRVLDSYGENGRGVIVQELVDGMATGRGARDIMARIRRRMIDQAGPRLDVLTRTELLRAYRGSLFDQYEGHVDEWIWSASYGPRTCLACLALGGTVHPMTERFMPSHPACRCSPSPKPRKLYGPPLQTGEEWFAQQDPGTQRSMMPTQAAFQAYRDGKVGLMDFVGMRHDPVWGDSVYERSGREALRSDGTIDAVFRILNPMRLGG